jgi:hypothetical protein
MGGSGNDENKESEKNVPAAELNSNIGRPARLSNGVTSSRAKGSSFR